MKIKKLIILGLVFFGMTSVSACQKINEGNKTVQTGGGSVEPAPVNSNAQALSAPNLTLNEKTVSWEKVENAANYIVNVNGVDLNNQTALNYTLTNTEAGDYVIKVKAVSGSDNFKNSEYSQSVTIKVEVPNVAISGNIEVLEAKGDLEEAYVTFNKLEGAKKYNAYVKESGSDTYKAIDTQLIREYKDNIRVDVVGLKAGLYDVKIVPVDDSGEKADYQTVVSNLNVSAYDRSGFAFVANNVNSTGDASGAYNTDGTLKSDARVIYVSSANAKTISLDMKVDSKGKIETRTGLQNIIQAYEKGAESRPLAVRILGKLSASDMDSLGSSAEGLQIKGKAAGTKINLTIEGIGNDATISGFGFLIRNCSNVEIRNLGFATLLDDDISFDTGNYNVWTHNCDFFYGKQGSGDHVKGDGALDVKGTMYATLSYNHFWDTGKTTLNSNGDAVDYVTYHHNWYDHSDSRHPRVRMSTAVHVYNNYYDGVSKYGIGAAEGGTSIFSEANYFRNCKNPIMSSMQGTDVYAGTTTYSLDNATFSKESGGIIKSFGDVMTGNYTFIPYGCEKYVCKGAEVTYNLLNTTSTVHFDAYVATTRGEIVPDTVVSVKGGTKYSNFDTASTMYTYTAQTAEEAKETVMAYAGRVQGGDLKWTFDNATEDTNYGLIAGLRKAIDEYSSKLVSVQGIESQAVTPSNPTDPSTPDTPVTPETPVDQNNFTISFSESTTVTTGKNVTAYDANGIKIVCTSIASIDKNGLKFNRTYGFTITNTSTDTRKLVLTVAGNGDNKDFSDGTNTVTFDKKGKTIEITLEPSTSITYTTSTGGAYLTSIVVTKA